MSESRPRKRKLRESLRKTKGSTKFTRVMLMPLWRIKLWKEGRRNDSLEKKLAK